MVIMGQYININITFEYVYIHQLRFIFLYIVGNNPGIFWVYQKETILNETDVSVTGVETSDCLYTCQSGDQSGCSSIERDIDANNCSYVTWSRYSGQKGIHHRPGKKSTYWEVHNAGKLNI